MVVDTPYQATYTLGQVQTCLTLPGDVHIPEYGKVEFRPTRDRDLLALAFPNRHDPVMTRQYVVTRHHNCTWVTIPNYWLRDRLAKNGSVVKLLRDGQKLLVQLVR